MERAGQLVRQIRWYWGSLMGDTHYKLYVEHRNRKHPGQPVLTEREYWKMRHAAADASPGARCC
jgi:uncharacterized short protein YbdD (DUF466 family)